MAGLGGEAIGADERMGKAPGPALQLTERLGQPAGEGKVIEFLKDFDVFLPQTIGSVRHYPKPSVAGVGIKV